MTISGTTGVLTILAHPSAKVTAPLIYNPIFEELGLNLAYVAENGVQLAGETVQLVIGQRQPGQTRQVGHFISGDLRHDTAA